MVLSMLRSFVLLLLLAAALTAGVFVGQTLPNLMPDFPPSEDHPRLVLRDALTEVSELVLVETAVKQTVTREIAGTLGGVSVRVDTVGVQRLGIDLSRARILDVDPRDKTVTVAIPPVEVLHAGLDHNATFITAHTTGLWPLSLAPSPEADLLAGALEDASDGLLVAPEPALGTPDLEARLTQLLTHKGWSVRVASTP